MEADVFKTVIDQAIGTFFGVLQAMIIVSVTALFKMYWDVRQLKKDVSAAHQKLREIQCKLSSSATPATAKNTTSPNFRG